jgi:hypothetical protein
MTATPISAATRYLAAGVLKIYFVASISNKLSPTRTELNAGTDLTSQVAEVNGWTVSSNLIDSPDYGSRFTSKTTGRTEVADSSLKIYASQDTNDVRSLLPRNTTGFVVMLWGGDVSSQHMDVFPVTVSSCGKEVPDSADADLMVTFAITSVPAEDVVIP